MGRNWGGWKASARGFLVLDRSIVESAARSAVRKLRVGVKWSEAGEEWAVRGQS